MLTIIKEHSRNGGLADHPGAGLLRGGMGRQRGLNDNAAMVSQMLTRGVLCF